MCAHVTRDLVLGRIKETTIVYHQVPLHEGAQAIVALSSVPTTSSGCHAVDSGTGASAHVFENMNANSLASPFSTNRIRTVRPCKDRRPPRSVAGHLTHRRSMSVRERLTHEKPGIVPHSAPPRPQCGPRSSTATSAFAAVASTFTTRKGSVINNG